MLKCRKGVSGVGNNRANPALDDCGNVFFTSSGCGGARGGGCGRDGIFRALFVGSGE